MSRSNWRTLTAQDRRILTALTGRSYAEVVKVHKASIKSLRTPSEKVARALDLIRKGATFKDAAASVGVTDHTVGTWAHRAGLKSGYKRPKRPKSDRHVKIEQEREQDRVAQAARKAEREAAKAERFRARRYPPPEVVAQIIAFFDEGRTEIPGHPGFVARRHTRSEMYTKFDSVDPNAIDLIVRRGAR